MKKTTDVVLQVDLDRVGEDRTILLGPWLSHLSKESFCFKTTKYVDQVCESAWGLVSATFYQKHWRSQIPNTPEATFQEVLCVFQVTKGRQLLCDQRPRGSANKTRSGNRKRKIPLTLLLLGYVFSYLLNIRPLFSAWSLLQTTNMLS